MLKDIIHDNKNKFKVSFLPNSNYSGVKIRLSIINERISEFDLNSFENNIRKKIEKYIYGSDNDQIELIVSELLSEKKVTISFAESCTGGYLSKKITDIPNCSDYFKGSVIAYDNMIKQKVLNVSNDLLNKKGAVSKEVALEMAYGVKKKFNTDIGVSTTGISGPGGGSKDKPIGLIYIAIIMNNKKIVKKFNLLPQRKEHREIAVQTTLNMIRLSLIEN